MFLVAITSDPFTDILAMTMPCGFDSITLRPTFGVIISNSHYFS